MAGAPNISSTDSLVRQLWGKTGPDDRFHPLLFHLLDVAAVAHRLVSEVLGEGLTSRWADLLGVSKEDLPHIVAFLCGSHDIGKACPGFQGKSKTQANRLKALGIPTDPEDVRHDQVSRLVLQDYFRHRLRVKPRVAARWAAAVAGHHGSFKPPAPHAKTSPGYGPKEPWPGIRESLLKSLQSVVAPDISWEAMADTSADNALLIQLAGLCSTADWIGSIEEYFPLTKPCMPPDCYWKRAVSQASRALCASGWDARPPDAPAQTFESLFPWCKPLRPLQEEAVGIAGFQPELVILEAPMGEGKTEAALYLAEVWRAERRQRGAYMALPTQATSNQMFRRFAGYLRQIARGSQIEFHLLHGHAEFSEQYAQIRVGQLYGDTDAKEGPAAHSWFQARKRGLLAAYGVGTVDQALLGVLKTRHSFVRLFGLSGKTVIFDEIHAYDLYMDELLDRCLEWLHAMGCTVVLLSATLPSERRRQLLSIWQSGEPEGSEAYPRLTAVTGNGVIVKSFAATERPPVALEVRQPEDGALWQALANKIAEGGCAAVICNTVRYAQDVFRQLKEICKDRDTEVFLLHARYLLRDRREREDAVLRMFGPEQDCRPRSAILVATQVVEQSLDLDFDFMVTEMAPVDLILQRSGRLHRHLECSRPAHLQRPLLWLLAPTVEPQGFPCFGTSQSVYAYTVLLRSWAVLRNRKEIRIPGDIEKLIEDVYSRSLAELGGEAGWEEEYARQENRENKEFQKQKCRAIEVLIPPPSSRDAVTMDTDASLVEDDPTVHRDFRAATRLGEPSVTTVFLHRLPDGQLSLDCNGKEGVDINANPDAQLTRKLIENSCSLSGRQVSRELLKLQPPPLWRNSGMLRYARLLIMEDGKTSLGSLSVRLDPDAGIVLESENDE